MSNQLSEKLRHALASVRTSLIEKSITPPSKPTQRQVFPQNFVEPPKSSPVVYNVAPSPIIPPFPASRHLPSALSEQSVPFSDLPRPPTIPRATSHVSSRRPSAIEPNLPSFSDIIPEKQAQDQNNGSLMFYIQALIARMDSIERLLKRKTKLKVENSNINDAYDEALSSLTTSVALLAQSDLIDRAQLKTFFDLELSHLIEISKVKHQLAMNHLLQPNIPVNFSQVQESTAPPQSTVEPLEPIKNDYIWLYFDSISPQIPNSQIVFGFLTENNDPLFPPRVVTFPCVRSFPIPEAPTIYVFIELQLPSSPPQSLGWTILDLCFESHLFSGGFLLPIYSPPVPVFSELADSELNYSGRSLYVRIELKNEKKASYSIAEDVYYTPIGNDVISRKKIKK
ncbi:hypothetical protein RCL1_007152 [Eukaryota sp. TZLM3-RCL]